MTFKKPQTALEKKLEALSISIYNSFQKRMEISIYNEADALLLLNSQVEAFFNKYEEEKAEKGFSDEMNLRFVAFKTSWNNLMESNSFKFKLIAITDITRTMCEIMTAYNFYTPLKN